MTKIHNALPVTEQADSLVGVGKTNTSNVNQPLQQPAKRFKGNTSSRLERLRNEETLERTLLMAEALINEADENLNKISASKRQQGARALPAVTIDRARNKHLESAITDAQTQINSRKRARTEPSKSKKQWPRRFKKYAPYAMAMAISGLPGAATLKVCKEAKKAYDQNKIKRNKV